MRSPALQHWKDVGVPVLAVVLVVLAFVAATSFVLVRSRTIGPAAAAITNNAVPSIELLLHARSELALLRVRLERHVEKGTAEPTSRALVLSTVGDLRRTLSRYVSLPKYPEEHELWASLLSSIDHLVASVLRIMAELEAGDAAAATSLFETEFRQAADTIERLLAESEELNAEQIKAFAGQIEAIRAGSRRTAIALNAVCVLLAVVLLRWVVRSARRYRDLQRSYLRQSQERAKEMEVFAGRVAHDILSPLGSASLALGLLAKSGDGEVVRIATRGIGGMNQVRSVVDGLLEFARAGARPTDDVSTDLTEIVENVAADLQEAATAAGVALELSTERGLTVSAHRGVITSILTNLVQNAIKHIGATTDRRVLIQAREREGRVQVEIHDTGPGVAPDLEQHVFEPYFRGKSQATPGLGLGLATVKRLVEAHGGRVGLRSTPGQGSVFWFDMPASAPRSH